MSDVAIYESASGQIAVTVEHDSVWLRQEQLAELFGGAFERGAQLAFNGGKSAHPARARAVRAQSCGFHVRLRFIAGHGNADAVLSVFVFDVVRVFAHPENGAGI